MAQLRDLVSQGKTTALSEGLWGAIYKIDELDRVLKVARDPSDGLHVIEKKIYERLGEHKFIAQFYGETELSNGRGLGLVLHYYPHGSLKDYFSVRTLNDPLDLQQQKMWASQFLRGLQYLHSCNIIHGDVGIKNLLLSEEKILKFSDFGGSSIDQSKLLVEPSPRYHRAHSWRFPIPGVDSFNESWQVPTPKVDTFAVGTVLYEIFTASLLYGDKDYDEIRKIFTRQDYPDLTDVHIPEVRRVIRKCWAEQYDSMNEICLDMKEILQYEAEE